MPGKLALALGRGAPESRLASAGASMDSGYFAPHIRQLSPVLLSQCGVIADRNGSPKFGFAANALFEHEWGERC